MEWGIAKLHPWLLLGCLALWLGGMFFYAQTPYCLLFLGANLLWYGWRLGRAGRTALWWYLLLSLLTVVFHLFFYHRGRHILFYLFGKPVLLESVIYGCYMGAFLFSLLLFWQVAARVYPRRKWIFLWRPLLPQTTMVFLFSGGLFARCKKSMQEKWQVFTYKSGAPQSFGERCRLMGNSLYAFAAWSLQWAMETVDSVNSRGYGLSPDKRGSRERYPFCRRDLLGVFLLVVSMVGGWLIGLWLQQDFYGNLWFIFTLGGFLIYWEYREGKIWRSYRE